MSLSFPGKPSFYSEPSCLTELPEHIEDETCKVKLLEAVSLTTGRKETKRAVDFRCSLLTTASYVRGTAISRVQNLLNIAVDMQDILYKDYEARSPRLILRYHNCSWYHHMLCKEIIGFQLHKMTVRKFYGTYLHELTVHGPIQLCIVSGRSSNAKEEERAFNTFKSITNTTSLTTYSFVYRLKNNSKEQRTVWQNSNHRFYVSHIHFHYKKTQKSQRPLSRNIPHPGRHTWRG